MKKKGQLQIQETMMVIFILVVIIILGLVLFYRFTYAGLEEEYNDNQMMRFQAMMATLPEIGEIKCGINGVEDNCIDVFKVITMNALQKQPNYKQYMIERYGFMDIRLKMVYPTVNEVECTTAVTDKCGVWTLYDNKPFKFKGVIKEATPVSIYLPYDKTFAIGMLEISKYIID